MLVLARRLNEKVVLPGLGITVQVRGIRRREVRLGIEAPTGVTILREELVGKPRENASAKGPEPCAVRKNSSPELFSRNRIDPASTPTSWMARDKSCANRPSRSSAADASR